MCDVASWIPRAVAATLSADRSAQPILAWLLNIRASTEDYDNLANDRTDPDTTDSDPPDATTPDSAFDEILSKLGKEIFQLDEFQRKLIPGETQVSLSILNIFDECLEKIESDEPKTSECCEKNSEEEICETEVMNSSLDIVTNGCGEHYSDNETIKEEPLVTSTPIAKVRTKIDSDPDCVFVKSDSVPIPPPRARLKLSSPSLTACTPERSDMTIVGVGPRPSESDSESTCWSYKEGSTDTDPDPQKAYAVVWSHSSGFHNSDEILRKVLLQHHATVSQLSFDEAGEFTPTKYSVYSLHEVGGRCAGAAAPVAVMTPDKPTERDDGYEPVRDAITDENIYEEIEFGYSYTDEGCSCGGSVEVESCSISASSSCMGRESPLYANLRDNDAYTITPDVIYWKNLLLQPDYNDDEEDEWITPEECAVYSREQRPPLVIPRITQYRAPRKPHNSNIYEDSALDQGPRHIKQYERLHDQSPKSERGRVDIERSFSKANSDSPPFVRINKRLGASTENLLAVNGRRPNNLHLPASSSGDSLDVEVRDKEPSLRKRQSRSMMASNPRVRSPVPAPRQMLAKPEITVDYEGPVKRTRYLESGKKCKKNWTDCYMVLTSTALVFYRDQKTYYASKLPKLAGTPPSPGAARAELVLPLKNAHVVQCIATYTRRFSRSVMLTVGYDQYLIQDETEEGCRRWLKSIQNIIYSLGPSEDFRPPQYQSSNTDLESLGRTPPVSRHANRNKTKAGGSSNEDLSDSTEVSIQKSHVRSRLRKFFARRPAMDVLIKKGIYKDEPVFGRNLEEVCPATSPRVPDFVIACVKEIESNEENMSTDGLYRASGNLSQVQKIRLEIDQNNLSVIESSADIHVLTGSLKLFFRELKEPLIPCSMFDRVLAACSLKSREVRIKEFRDIVQALPQCNRDTLKYLLQHLLRVTQYSDRNRMHTANLAIVFGPTLLWAPAEQAHNIAIDCIQQNNVVEILLNDYKDIFVDDTTKGKKKA